MRRPFMDHGKNSKRGLGRYRRIKVMNEGKHAWRVMKYQFSSDAEGRISVYRIRIQRGYRDYFRMKLSGRAVERLLQFHRPWRGNASFRMSAYRPKNILVDDVD